MKKQWRMIIISAGVMVALLVTWIVVGLFKPGATTETTTTTKADVTPLYEAASTDISRVEVHNDKGGFALYTSESTDKNGKVTVTWNLETDKKTYPFEQDLLDGIGSTATRIIANQEIATGVTDFAPYGLDKPAATMTVILKSGDKHVIKFGNEIISKYYDYATVDDTGRVCTVASGSGDKAKLTLLDLLDKTKVVNITSTDLTHFVFSRARDQVRIAIDCQLKGEAGTDSAYMEFKVTEPIKRDGSSDPLNKLVTEASSITAVEYIELEPKDLAKYGLDNPQYTFTLQTKDKNVTVSFGKVAEGGKYYAISDVFPAVFTVFSSYQTMIDLPVIQMLDTFINLQEIWLVDTIEADLFGTRFTSLIKMDKSQTSDDEGVVFLLDGQNANIFSQEDTSLFSRFYQRLISIRIADLDTKAQPVNTHDGKITYKIKEDKDKQKPAHTKVIEFARRDDYTYYVFIDNVYTGFYVDGENSFTKDDTIYPPDDINNDDGLIIAYQKLKYAMAHAVDGVFDTTKGYQLG